MKFQPPILGAVKFQGLGVVTIEEVLCTVLLYKLVLAGDVSYSNTASTVSESILLC